MSVASPISPGRSWYALNTRIPPTPTLDGEHRCDVAIIGGGFTGLSAAYHLAQKGVKVVVLEGAGFGDGASGRNGGQLGTGQRQWVDVLEKQYGFERTKVLFGLAEEAKNFLLALTSYKGNDVSYQKGHISAIHRPRHVKTYQEHIDKMGAYGYHKLTFLNRDAVAAQLGTAFYYGGVHDSGTGHLNPLKLVVVLMRLAREAGAELFHNSYVEKLAHEAGAYKLYSRAGSVIADRVLIATNGYGSKLDPQSDKFVAPIRSYIAATAPLKAHTILPNSPSVDDSRFVVRYFRKEIDGSLLFGGAESYAGTTLRDIAKAVRRQLVEVYPELQTVDFTHAWGGSVGITVNRMPFVRDVMPGVTYCGGFSGHGVMLAPFLGKLYADALTGDSQVIDIFRQLNIAHFPGGQTLRRPLLFLALKWFSLLDWI